MRMNNRLLVKYTYFIIVYLDTFGQTSVNTLNIPYIQIDEYAAQKDIHQSLFIYISGKNLRNYA